MKVQIRDDFIGIFEDALDPKACKRYIDFFEKKKAMGLVVDRQQTQKCNPTNIKDLSFSICPETMTMQECSAQISGLTNLINACVKQYTNAFPSTGIWGSEDAGLIIQDMKIQKTGPGDGYHVWHAEWGDGRANRRVLAFSIFLNTVEEGGETEFLYQNFRMYPDMGTLALWPAYFTHIHRGNPPIGATKYIITGWLERK